MTTREQLVEAFGAEWVGELMARFGGRVIRIPTIDHAERNRRIVAMLERSTYRSVADQFELSIRQVQRIAKETLT